MKTHSLLLTALAFTCVSCGTDAPVVRDSPVSSEPAATPPEPVIRRLTESQYENSVHDLFGEDIVLPLRIEPDIEQDGLLSIGSAHNSLSPLGVEQYEEASFSLAEQALAPGPIRDAIMPCQPAAIQDADCARNALSTLGRQAWRRPLTNAELDTIVALSGTAADIRGDFYLGLELGLGTLLQSPYFVYRVELGEAAPEGGRRYTNNEMATKLSYFLWNTAPDEALLTAAENGELTESVALTTQVERMLDDPKARQGFRNLISEMLALYELDELSKDPNVFPAMRTGIGPSAREETLLTVEALVFDRQDDFRSWMTTRDTFVDQNLAMIYAVAAPNLEGFGPTHLPDDGLRSGLLGQVSILATAAHPVSSSATLRGLFVRNKLLCQDIPPPPADVDTSIPEPEPGALTLRDRVASHLEDDFCATCHSAMDPIGLALENFDGIGIYRETENGVVIDAHGEIDGESYDNAEGLGRVLALNPGYTACMTDTVFGYAEGHRPTLGELGLSEWLLERFEQEGYSMKSLLREVATSQAFRTPSEVVQ